MTTATTLGPAQFAAFRAEVDLLARASALRAVLRSIETDVLRTYWASNGGAYGELLTVLADSAKQIGSVAAAPVPLPQLSSS